MDTHDWTIPPEIDAQYEGRWIAWDTETQQVICDGESLEEVMSGSDEIFDAGHLIWYHHILPHDAIIVGGL